ncbi:hypothetical protein B6259_03855 [Ruminococcaceae bacterium CPB6]|jgi:hypothetical protein|nr:hypothetical protein B6259_03855 [Ruminococcaceae bacterium CPB6]
MTLKEAKHNYLTSPNDETYRDFCAALQNSKMFMLAEWNLTKSEEQQFKDFEPDDVIHIDTKMLPVAFEFDENRWIIPVFSDRSSITDRYSKKYTVLECNSRTVLVTYNAYKKVTGKEIRILLDMNSESLDFDDEELLYSK